MSEIKFSIEELKRQRDFWEDQFKWLEGEHLKLIDRARKALGAETQSGDEFPEAEAKAFEASLFAKDDIVEMPMKLARWAWSRANGERGGNIVWDTEAIPITVGENPDSYIVGQLLACVEEADIIDGPIMQKALKHVRTWEKRKRK